VKIQSSITPIGKSADSSRPLATATKQPPTSAPTDQVELSGLATRLQEASAALGGSPVVNTARVAEIRQAIAEGRFQIHPERIADGLLQSVRDLIGGK
jgi:negative regulator of flagellin synthesis FlgM